MQLLGNKAKDDLNIEIKKGNAKNKPVTKTAPFLFLDSEQMELRKYEIFIEVNAWKALWEHAFSVRDREVGGALIGDFCKDKVGSGYFLDVIAILKAEHAVEETASLTFTHDTWNALHEQVDKNFSDKAIVGWYHTHPGFGVQLSKKDVFIHDNFFSLPYQIALVLDPLSKTYLYYISNKDEYKQSNKIFVYIDSQSDSDVSALAKLYYPGEAVDKAINLVNMSRLHGKETNQDNPRCAVCFDDTRTKELLDFYF